MPEAGSAEKGMGSVGSYLREVRESRGIDLDEAARVTRIGRNYLAAIEGESFDKLPSTAYVKGFLRVYAGYLGISGDEVIAMFDKSCGCQPAQSSREADNNERRRFAGKAPSIPARWLVPLLLFCAVCIAAYFFGDREEMTVRLPREHAPEVTGAQVASQPAPAPVQPVRSSTTQNPLPAVAADAPKTPAVAADTGTESGIILRLKVNQDCWLNITIDNSVSQQYDLKAGDLIEWKGEKVFALDIGNAGGIEGELNGKPLKPFGEPGKTAHVILTNRT
ncbi:MAG TPA: RodZ domain-containing protein [Geobacteraceae bacterium]|nr:RodZ domain-containing protein [Geobacteraceae bacterium]